MADDSSREQIRQMVLIGILAAGVCYIAYAWYISPARTELAAAEVEVESLRFEVQQAQVAEARLPKLLAEIKVQESELRRLRQVLPTEKETAEVVRRVQALAVESNLHLKSFTPQAMVSNEFYQDWPILLSIEGNYDNLGIFFERIAQFDRIINVDSLSIRPVENPSRDRTIAATCTATTYVFQEATDDT